jgi:enterochelin esterase family protein
MKNLATAALLITLWLIPSGAKGQEADTSLRSPRLRGLTTAEARGDHRALPEFWDQVRRAGTPRVEEIPGDSSAVLLTFLYRGDSATKNVALFRGIEVSLNLADNAFIQLPGTDVWYRTYSSRRDARTTYVLGVNADLSPMGEDNSGEIFRRLRAFGLDPMNPRKFPPSGQASPIYLNSVIELPWATPQPWVAKRDGAPAGVILDTTFRSSLTSNERKLSVYLPPSHRAGSERYDLLILFDREEYLTLVPTATILDNLLADGRIGPTVAILVGNPPNTRGPELHCSRPFAEFLATELLPWAQSRFGVSGEPGRITLAGSSAGGLASACAALMHPERFGNVISMSGAYWWRPEGQDQPYEWAVRQFEASSKLPIRFYLAVGLMEGVRFTRGVPTILETNRHLRDVLIGRGYEVEYAEFNGGHEHLSWQGVLGDGLARLFQTRRR